MIVEEEKNIDDFQEEQSLSLTQHLLILICILFCLGGAVNVGWTRFFLAIPFALLLIFIVKKNLTLLVGSILFIFFCIMVNYTSTSNPLFFPKLSKSIFIEEGCALVYPNSQVLYKYEPKAYGFHQGYISKTPLIDKKKTLKQECESKKLQDLESIFIDKGTYSVVGVWLSAPDMSSKSHYIIQVKDGKKVVEQRIQAQSNWTNNLSSLMYYPAIPILIMSLLNGSK